MSGAVISGNFHQPGSLVQVNSKCQNTMSSILVSGVDGLLVAAESAINAHPNLAPVADGGDPAGVALVASGTDTNTWTARNVRITSCSGYAKNDRLVALPDCPLCTDVEFGDSGLIVGEPTRDYGSPSINQSLWHALPGPTSSDSSSGAGGGGEEQGGVELLLPSVLPSVVQLPASKSFEQQPTFEWRMPSPIFQQPVEEQQKDDDGGGGDDKGAITLGVLALELDLTLNPSLAAVSMGPNTLPPSQQALSPATVVVSIAAKLSCPTCSLHFVVGTSAGWNTSLAVNTSVAAAAGGTGGSGSGSGSGSWERHSFVTRLPTQLGGTLSVGLALRFGTTTAGLGLASLGLPGGTGTPPAPGEVLATMAGFSVRRLGAPVTL